MIKIVDLVKRHGDMLVLNGISMNVQPGEVVTLIGPSGGGKSTLLRCINGLERFQAGEIVVADMRLSHQPNGECLRELRRRVGMVFQQFHLFPHMTVLENVMSGLRIVLGYSRDQAEMPARELLERVGLGDKLHVKPESLSGGQQQRVAIARALAVRPEAILFDEPTSALDPRMANEVLRVISDLAASGQTMVVVTHAMGFARKVSHTVHVMCGGRIVESGPPDKVFEAPEREDTKRFFSKIHAD